MTRMRSLFFLAILTLSVMTARLAAVSYIAFEQVTVANTAIGFTAGKINPAGQNQATLAVCRLETAEIRYTLDGTTPTSSVGTLMEIGDMLAVQGNDVLRKFSAIRTGGSSGQLDCTYSAP